jgi:hypothetical protein
MPLREHRLFAHLGARSGGNSGARLQLLLLHEARRRVDLESARCGIVPVVTSRIDDHLYAVVSVNAFEEVDPSLLRRASASFDGEGEDSRLARRKRSWIANVEFSVPK